jgi:hypothetical protein
MKYSKNFERDYTFYLNNLDTFNFCGTLNPKHTPIPNGTKSAKEVFFMIESHGKNEPTSEPELLEKLLLTKASVNFQIKEWAQGLSDMTLPFYELSQKKAGTDLGDVLLEWENKEPVYYKDIQTKYNLPDWVVTATFNQVCAQF